MIISIFMMLSSLKIMSPWDENASLPLLLIVYSVRWQRTLSKGHFYLGQSQSVCQSECVCFSLPPSAPSASLPSSLGTYIGEGRWRTEKSNESKRIRQNQTHSHSGLKLWSPLIITEQEERFSAVFWETGEHQCLIYCNSNSCAKFN